MKIIRRCLALLAFMALPLCASAAENVPPQAIILDKIAAVVNGEIITLHELRQHAASELVRSGINPMDSANRPLVDQVMSRVLSVMIDDMLLRQEAERLQIKVSEADIDNEMRKLVQHNQISQKEFEARLTAQGGTMEMLRERLRNSILSQRIINIMISRKSIVTPEEVSTYYEKHKDTFSAERTVDFSLITFSSSSKPQEIVQKIRNGSLSFEEAAKKFSEGPVPDSGGRVGAMEWEDLAPPFKAQVLQLKEGEISEPFHVNGRDFLLKLNGVTSGRAMTLEEATPEIERILREPRLQDRFIEYTEQLRSRAVVDIRL